MGLTPFGNENIIFKRTCPLQMRLEKETSLVRLVKPLIAVRGYFLPDELSLLSQTDQEEMNISQADLATISQVIEDWQYKRDNYEKVYELHDDMIMLFPFDLVCEWYGLDWIIHGMRFNGAIHGLDLALLLKDEDLQTKITGDLLRAPLERFKNLAKRLASRMDHFFAEELRIFRERPIKQLLVKHNFLHLKRGLKDKGITTAERLALLADKDLQELACNMERLPYLRLLELIKASKNLLTTDDSVPKEGNHEVHETNEWQLQKRMRFSIDQSAADMDV